MPIYNSGLGASFGVGVEATGAIGTFVAPTGWYEITDESFQLVPKYLDSTSLKPGQAYTGIFSVAASGADGSHRG